MFKLKQDASSPWYAEVGVGAHYLSNVRIKDYSKSTQFQFGDQFGLGWENDQFRVGYRYLHISNGNIETPNPATDFQTLEVGYRY
jgi:opacity protein-like surface antigen